MDFAACSFGVQVANDGRVWVCVNGVAWLRFARRATGMNLLKLNLHYRRPVPDE